MKKIKYFLLAAMVLTGCSKETPQVDSQPGEVTKLPVFKATLESPQSRVEMSGMELLWQYQDVISVFPKTEDNIEYMVVGEGSTVGFFNVNSKDNSLDGSALNYNGAVYPYNENITAENIESGLAFNVTIPSDQIADIDPEALVMVGVSDNDMFEFKNVCSMLELSFAGDTDITEIILTSNDSTKISGLGKVSFPMGGTPVWEADENNSKASVTTHYGAGIIIDSTPRTLHMLLAPVTLSKGFTIKIIDKSGTTLTKTASAPFTFKRGHIHRMPGVYFDAKPSSKTMLVGNVSFNMIPIEKNSFLMGTQKSHPNGENYDMYAQPNESPVHLVKLTQDYWVGETEVTQALWKQVMGADNNPSKYKDDQKPVEQVTHDDIVEFIEKLNAMNIVFGYQFDLPTEAQWEYAARGANYSDNWDYSGAYHVEDVAHYGYDKDKDPNKPEGTVTVKSKAHNELGIYDMSGNVYEMCKDRYAEKYPPNYILVDPTGPDSGGCRVIRGGAWNTDENSCRTAARQSIMGGESSSNCGFRLVMYKSSGSNTEGMQRDPDEIQWDN